MKFLERKSRQSCCLWLQWGHQ